MVVDLSDSDRRQNLLYSFLALTPGILLFRGIIADPAILNLSLDYRFAYPLAHANPAGFLFAMSIPMCLAMMMIGATWRRHIAIVSFASQLAALILTFSRAAWAAAGASLMSIGGAERKLRVPVVIVAATALTALAASGELSRRAWSLTHGTKDPYVAFRGEVLLKAIAVGIDRPFLGNGYGRDHLRAALRTKYPEFAPDGFVNHSHNLYSELTAGVGILGVAIFMWLLGAAGIKLIRQIRTRGRADKERYADLGLLGALISFLVAALGDVPFYHHEPRIFFFTLLGLICLRLRPKSHAENCGVANIRE
jgi:O-antigen ligase